MKYIDRVEGLGGFNEGLQRGGIAEIGLNCACIFWVYGLRRDGRRNDVCENEGVLWFAEETFCEELADEACCAGDENGRHFERPQKEEKNGN